MLILLLTLITQSDICLQRAGDIYNSYLIIQSNIKAKEERKEKVYAYEIDDLNTELTAYNALKAHCEILKYEEEQATASHQ